MDILENENDYRIVEYLSVNGGARFSTIEKELNLNPKTVNKALKRLRKGGLIVKEGDKYYLTEKGRKEYRAASDVIAILRVIKSEKALRREAGGALNVTFIPDPKNKNCIIVVTFNKNYGRRIYELLGGDRTVSLLKSNTPLPTSVTNRLEKMKNFLSASIQKAFIGDFPPTLILDSGPILLPKEIEGRLTDVLKSIESGKETIEGVMKELCNSLNKKN